MELVFSDGLILWFVLFSFLFGSFYISWFFQVFYGLLLVHLIYIIICIYKGDSKSHTNNPEP